MPLEHNVFDISLLRKNPDAFILLCQKAIHITVKQYTKSGMFDKEEHDDIIQTVNEKLIEKLPSIAVHFSGEVLLQTYINVVIRRICLQLYKGRNKVVETIPLSEHIQADGGPDLDLIIEAEIQRFHTIMQLYQDDRFKMVICFKLHYRLPLRRYEIVRWCPKILKDDKESLMMTFGGMYEEMEVEKVFEEIAAMFNKYEEKAVHGDSIRRWTKAHVEKTIKLLNGTPPRRTHSDESLKILLDKYSMQLPKLT
ncbi:MAG: hypothetical protein PHP42_10790 [Bacteroidota bacterium]|nr:hypothetical protein [Bacteroidota bacterium]